MNWLAAFIENGEIGQGEFFLGLRPKKRRVLAGPFLQRLMKGGYGLLQLSCPVCAENLNPDVMVMKAAEDGVRFDASDPLNGARDRRIFIQRPMRSYVVIIVNIGSKDPPQMRLA